MIHVLAIITTHPGQRAAVLEQFRANVPAVLAEPGCIEYAPAIDLEGAPSYVAALGPDSFAVIEKWQDAAALAAQHMRAYGAKVKDMLASRVIHVLSPA
jgi:quinol monooxygenase YgiN